MTEKFETQYGIIKGTPVLPIKDLLIVPHRARKLIVSHPVFGQDTYQTNLTEMQKKYFHSAEKSEISFREPSISESISACAYEFGDRAKPQILDPRWLQLGRIVRTSEGVFTNPPKDEKGNPITDETVLNSHLNGIKKVNGIYLLENDFGFAPYESFTRGIQDCDTFVRGGLGRLLEHTKEEAAKNLKEIASPKFYKRGVNVLGFDSVEKPVLKVASLYSYRYSDSDRLGVGGDNWIGGSDGCAFGVLNSAEGSAKK